MNKLDKDYCNLLQDILDNGVKKETRNGGTISVFGRQIRHDMKTGFPLITTKKMAFKTMVTELLWFLRGDTNIKYLVDNNCHIWDGDCYQAYVKKHKHAIRTEDNRSEIAIQMLEEQLIYPKEEFINKIKTDDEFAKKWGELGPIYGSQWRNWVRKTTRDEKIVEPGVYETSIDQIQNLINDLKTNPDSRRLMVNAWNVGELDKMTLPPCHYGFQVYTRELSLIERINIAIETGLTTKTAHLSEEDYWKWCDEKNIPTRAISLMWNQRSCDFPLGIPMNIASYGLLLEIIAKIVNMVPDELIGNFGDCHIYLNQIEGVKEQIGRPYTPEERHELLKTAMGDFYQTAVDEQVPFGGGLSEYYEAHKIPYHSRESFELPTLKLPKTDAFWNGFDVSLFGHLEPTDFIIENYQSHPKIFFPLSN
jgi:thymidylate synthase